MTAAPVAAKEDPEGMAKNGNDPVEKARAQAANVLSRLGRVEARAEKRRSALDTKRKILLGAALQTMMKADASLRGRVQSFMKDFLVRDAERAAFDLAEPVTYFDQLCDEPDDVDAAVDALTSREASRAGNSAKAKAPPPSPPAAPGTAGAPNGSAARPGPTVNATPAS